MKEEEWIRSQQLMGFRKTQSMFFMLIWEIDGDSLFLVKKDLNNQLKSLRRVLMELNRSFSVEHLDVLILLVIFIETFFSVNFSFLKVNILIIVVILSYQWLLIKILYPFLPQMIIMKCKSAIQIHHSSRIVYLNKFKIDYFYLILQIRFI